MNNDELEKRAQGRLIAISIENFRGIERLDLSFRSPKGDANSVVVLAGPNGGGKTSVLEACILISGQVQFVKGPTDRTAIRFGAEDYTVEGKFLLPDGTTFHQRRTPRIGAKSRFPCLYLHSGRTNSLVGPLGISAGSETGESVAASTSLSRTKRQNAGTSYLGAIKQHLINAWAHSLAGLRPGSSTASEHYRSSVAWIDRLWAMFYPDSDQKFAVDSAGSDPDDGFDVYLFGPGKTRLPVDFLSSGQLELFTLAGLTGLLKSTPNAVFIDEVELHLDPQWHRLILHALRTLMPDTQFIVTTHSSEVYNSVRSFERHFLVPDGDPRAKPWAAGPKADAGR